MVAETLNIEGLSGYSTGGTLHLIANNQIGFTTDPAEGRSTRYSSDLAKGFDIPIIHVNADDPEAAISAIRLALAFRRRFGHDVVVDLVGYRRFGHNEQDEPAYTQPLMAARIAAHPTVREQFAAHLVAEGVITAGGGRRARSARRDDAQGGARAAEGDLRAAGGDARSSLRGWAARRTAATPPSPPSACASSSRSSSPSPTTSPSTRSSPASSSAASTALDEGGIDWGQAESLAFASACSSRASRSA